MKSKKMLNRLHVSGGKWRPPEKRNAGEMDAEKIFFKLFIFQCGIYAKNTYFDIFFIRARRNGYEPSQFCGFWFFFSFWITWVEELHHGPMLDYYLSFVFRLSFFYGMV